MGLNSGYLIFEAAIQNEHVAREIVDNLIELVVAADIRFGIELAVVDTPSEIEVTTTVDTQNEVELEAA